MILPISVIIPTMNRPDSLARTLKYMASSTNVPGQVIIVDQSQDQELRKKNEDILNSYKIVFGEVVYKYQELPGLTKARNNGYESVKNEIIVCSDDDVDVNVNTFANIYQIMNDTNVAMIAGIDELSQLSKTNIGYFLGTKSYINRKIGHVTSSMLGRFPDNITTQIETQWAQGYFFVVRKSLLDRWNIRWDENLISYAYAEDLDFSFSYYKHAKKEGLCCVLNPKVKVKHLATLEYRVPSAQSTYMYVVNRKYLACKHKMGFIGILGRNWCELWRFVQSVILRQNPDIFLKAYLCKFKYSHEINTGKLYYDEFMK